MIIEDTCNRFYRVRPAPAGMDHVWIGIEVKRVRGAYVAKAKARERLVRKEATRVVEC